MSAGTRFPAKEAKLAAEEFCRLIEPYCEKARIAGSLRRGKPDVGDIEVVAVPRTRVESVGLFEDSATVVNELFLGLSILRAEGTIQERRDDRDRACWGERHQRAVYKGIPLDLFSVLEPAQWGVIYLIRTGPADFSHRMVTSSLMGGRLPGGCRVQDGRILDQGKPVLTPSERDYFAFCGMAFIEPGDRA